jgi:RNA polymerase sigma factor (sigma-70 family)
MDMTKFEELLSGCRNAMERFVYYKLPSKADGDDVLQEVYLTAFQKFDTLKDEKTFKAWLIRIATNKCNDFYRNRAKQLEIPLEEITARVFTQSRFGIAETTAVGETLDKLSEKDKQILYLYFFKNKPQAEIAKALGIPLGTVKSRLYNAKQNFKEKYPYSPILKGESTMNKLPDMMPKYQISKSEKQPFTVECKEMGDWFFIPELGQKCSWAIYDVASKLCENRIDIESMGKVMIHGIYGVEFSVRDYSVKSNKILKRFFVAQLADTHTRWLAETHYENDCKMATTFLDEKFLENWSVGENNCGYEILLKQNNSIIVEDKDSFVTSKKNVMDVVGRYTVSILNKIYDTVLFVEVIDGYNSVLTKRYIDQNGRTVLFQRYNSNNWAANHYKEKWSEKLPENEIITVNGETYVHWYDCITDFIL